MGLVLDSINFRWHDKDGKKHMLYGVLAGYGYDELLHHCEHHLRQNAIAAIDREKVISRDEIRRLFANTLLTGAG